MKKIRILFSKPLTLIVLISLFLPSIYQVQAEKSKLVFQPSVVDGWIKIGEISDALAELSDLTGAYYDTTRNQFVLIGTKDPTLPKLNKDDLVVAIRAIIFNNTDPGMSMDFDGEDYSSMKVSYRGGTEDTNFGKAMLEADLQLKRYGMGYNEKNETIVSLIPGYQSVLNRWIEAGPDLSKKIGSYLTISPKKVTLRVDGVNQAFVFDKVEMQVTSKSLFADNDSAWNKASQDFAQHQTENYDKFATEVPSYLRAKQLAKIAATVRWMKDSKLFNDYQWIKSYTPQVILTAREVTPIIPLKISQGNYRLFITGGLKYSISNTYKSDTNSILSSFNNAPASDLDNNKSIGTVIRSIKTYTNDKEEKLSPSIKKQKPKNKKTQTTQKNKMQFRKNH